MRGSKLFVPFFRQEGVSITAKSLLKESESILTKWDGARAAPFHLWSCLSTFSFF